jgi:hypothetical protein
MLIAKTVQLQGIQQCRIYTLRGLEMFRKLNMHTVEIFRIRKIEEISKKDQKVKDIKNQDRDHELWISLHLGQRSVFHDEVTVILLLTLSHINTNY